MSYPAQDLETLRINRDAQHILKQAATLADRAEIRRFVLRRVRAEPRSIMRVKAGRAGNTKRRLEGH